MVMFRFEFVRKTEVQLMNKDNDGNEAEITDDDKKDYHQMMTGFVYARWLHVSLLVLTF
jgi:hypothetical protein